MLAQHPQHAPLLIGQTLRSQTGTGVRHHGFTGLQKQKWQIAVNKWEGCHLFNMLNDSMDCHSRVYPCFQDQRRLQACRLPENASFINI
jgi:hypothetical protein